MATLDDVEGFIAARIRWQPAITAIANTVKHAEHRDTGWAQGTATVASFVPPPLQADKEACLDGVELFSFMHQHQDVAWWDIALCQAPSVEAVPGYIALGDTLEEWRVILDELGYVDSWPLAAYISPNRASVSPMLAGVPTWNHRPGWERPNMRALARALFQARHMVKGSTGSPSNR